MKKEMPGFVNSLMVNTDNEECVVLQRNGVPVVKVIPYKKSSRSRLFGRGNNLFTIPDNFDDLDITTDFEDNIL